MSLTNSIPESNTLIVYCICGGIGFPVGTASTQRIRLIGRCLASNGIPFHVWHIGPSPFKGNTDKIGAIDGITFEYLSPSVSWPSSKVIRMFYYLWGHIKLLFRLFHAHRKAVAYVYFQGNLGNLLALWLCRLMKISAVQEVCEWWPGTPSAEVFNKWMYNRIMFKWTNGALVISQEIRKRIESIAGSDYPVCMVPALVDSAENQSKPKESHYSNSSVPSFLWCGMVDGYKRDVYFLIDAMAELKSTVAQNSLLRIVGPCSESMRIDLLAYTVSKNISKMRLDIVGFVSDTQLWEYYAKADALLMPLWDDDRSRTRFPTKLGQYVAAGRPIVTARVGEIGYFLNEKTAFFYTPGDSKDIARCMDYLIDNQSLGDEIATRATREVLPKIDFRNNAAQISNWFYKLYYKHASNSSA